ncbi:hypothetical protein AB0J28_19615 [Streptosporangium canum]|uniref:hypothetical protein n=1 Tax=Streptosporangium canum TaxID=324952 RepID=UPI0034319E81
MSSAARAASRKVTALRGEHVDLTVAADAYLSTTRVDNPHTHRAYASAIDRTIILLGADRCLADITDCEIGQP